MKQFKYTQTGCRRKSGSLYYCMLFVYIKLINLLIDLIIIIMSMYLLKIYITYSIVNMLLNTLTILIVSALQTVSKSLNRGGDDLTCIHRERAV